ncbi:MAG: hypothetical protein JKY54_09930 [Flavobacteriales bacterium]|nr:hypothetical protein [Flavobacteriales bacterium]
MKTMNRYYASDITTWLDTIIPYGKNIIVFDPDGKLIEDEPISLTYLDENATNILVNLGGEMIQYKGISLDEFDLIIDFSNEIKLDGRPNLKLSFITHTSGKVRWIFKKGTLNFLNLKQALNLNAKIKQLAIKVFFRLGLARVYTNCHCSIIVNDDSSFPNHIKILNKDYAYSGGVQGIERTPVVSFLNNRDLQFIKFSSNRQTLGLMKNELRMNRVWRMKELETAVFPQVQKFSDKSIISLKTKPIDAESNWTKQHANFIMEITDKSIHQVSYKTSEMYVNVQENLGIIKTYSKNLIGSSYLLNALTELHEKMHYAELLFAHSHGDFTPWNSSVSDDKLYIIDLEHASMGRPILHDFFHFHFQKGALLERAKWPSIQQEINRLQNGPLVQSFINKWNIDPEIYLKAYVLNYVSFQIASFCMQGNLSKDQEVLLNVWKDVLMEWHLGYSSINRKNLVKEIQQALGAVSHVYLKQADHPNELSENSDLDILLSKESTAYVLSFIKGYPGIERLKIVRKSYMTSVYLRLNNGEKLDLDFISEFVHKGKRYLDRDLVLKSSVFLNGYPRPALKHEIENLMLFYGLNGAAVPSKYQNEINGRVKWQTSSIVKYINAKYQLDLKDFSNIYNLKVDQLKQVKRQLTRGKFLKNAVLLFNCLNDTRIQLTQNRGFICTLSGVDGAGKTTIIESLSGRLKLKFRKEVVLLRHRPGILPILSSFKYGQKEAEKMASVNIPRQGTNHNVISSLIRFGYYYLDYLIGQFYVNFKYTWRGKIVLYDRYYFDFINDAERSNIRLSHSFRKSLYAFLFKPRINFFLHASPEVIRSRKKELSTLDISTLNKRYFALFKEYAQKYNGKYILIENINKEQTIQRIIKELSAVA